jgi:hypothetical protein
MLVLVSQVRRFSNRKGKLAPSVRYAGQPAGGKICVYLVYSQHVIIGPQLTFQRGASFEATLLSSFEARKSAHLRMTLRGAAFHFCTVRDGLAAARPARVRARTSG